MATANQRLKQIYLMKVLLDNTDETHSMTMPEIVTALNEYGISAERKSIYDDIEALRVFGMDIIGEKSGRTFMYHVGSRDFELAELKILIDERGEAKERVVCDYVSSMSDRFAIAKFGEIYLPDSWKD